MTTNRRHAASLPAAVLFFSGIATFAAEPHAIVVIGEATGKIAPGPLNEPFGVDLDAAGNMYIVEYGGGRVFKRTLGGKLHHIGGTGARGYGGDGGPAIKATFNQMHNVAATDGGDLYISDQSNHRIRRIDGRSGIVTTVAGNGMKGFGGDGGPARKAQFNLPICVTLNPKQDTLYVADIRNRRIRAIDLATDIVTTVAGNGKKGVPRDGDEARRSPLVDPRAVAVDGHGNLYILERGGHALRVVRPDGRTHTLAGSGKKGRRDGPALAATMNGPKHLALDAAGNIYIADDNNNLVRKYDAAKKTLTTVLGAGSIKLRRPHGVCVRDRSLFVADSMNHRVLHLPLADLPN